MELTEQKLYEALGVEPETPAPAETGGKQPPAATPPGQEQKTTPSAESGEKAQEPAEPAKAEGEIPSGGPDGHPDPVGPEGEPGASAEKPGGKPGEMPKEQRREAAAARRRAEQQAAIDEAVQKAVQEEKGRAKEEMAAFFKRAHLKNTLTGAEITTMEEFEDGYGDIMVDSQVLTDDEKWFSLELVLYQGAGSGYERHRHYTIDKTTGKRAELSEFFGEDYVKTVSEEVKAQMRSRMEEDENVFYWIDYEDVPEWNFESIAEDQDFYVNKDGNVVICFDEYEVAPGYMGCVEFVVEQDMEG